MKQQNQQKRTVKGTVNEVHDFAKRRAHSVGNAYSRREDARVKGFLAGIDIDVLPEKAFDEVLATVRKNAVSKATIKEGALVTGAIIGAVAVLKEIL